MDMPIEPTRLAMAHPLRRFFAATRPPFLSVTLVGCLLGLACARAAGSRIDVLLAVVATVFALVAHAGVNVLNDYFDSRSGADAANVDRIFPFTGGSRFIQNGVLGERETATYGYTLLLAVVPAGLWLAWRSTTALVYVGLAGLIVGWAYSAPPLKLVNRGLGEIAITLGWLLVVAGSALVQRQPVTPATWVCGLAYALLVANVLFMNQFPDARSDAVAGKRTLVVRLGPRRARSVYPSIAALSAACIAGGVVAGILPRGSLWALLALVPSGVATGVLWKHATEPRQLAPAIRATILAAVLQGLLLAAALRWS